MFSDKDHDISLASNESESTITLAVYKYTVFSK
jgi:hypothetical protein